MFSIKLEHSVRAVFRFGSTAVTYSRHPPDVADLCSKNPRHPNPDVVSFKHRRLGSRHMERRTEQAGKRMERLAGASHPVFPRAPAYTRLCLDCRPPLYISFAHDQIASSPFLTRNIRTSMLTSPGPSSQLRRLDSNLILVWQKSAKVKICLASEPSAPIPSSALFPSFELENLRISPRARRRLLSSKASQDPHTWPGSQYT
jgi:hypothetical protein